MKYFLILVLVVSVVLTSTAFWHVCHDDLEDLTNSKFENGSYWEKFLLNFGFTFAFFVMLVVSSLFGWL